jgi:glycosyltransferase involved in cell wall biosynthesis
MRKLAIDLTYQPTGGSIPQITEIINNIDYYDFDSVIFYITKDNLNFFKDSNNKKITLNSVRFSNKSIIFRTIWAQIVLPILLVIDNIDVLFCPGNISPIINSRKKAQWIGTIGPFEKDFISFFSIKNRIILFFTKYLMIFSSYTSDMVIFESNYTRELFFKKYKQKLKKSSVIHIGNNSFYKPVSIFSSKIIKDINECDFILTVSHLYPYKNLEVLIKSFYDLKLRDRGMKILIAGSKSDKKYYKKIQDMINQYEISDSIIFLGNVKKEDLRELYSKCKIFVFTSPYENFAYTLVEAMSCGAPIVASNTTAMPETCDNAALYFSPDSFEELSKCILTFLNDEETRRRYKEMSLIKSNSYDLYSEVNIKTSLLIKKIFNH